MLLIVISPEAAGQGIVFTDLLCILTAVLLWFVASRPVIG